MNRDDWKNLYQSMRKNRGAKDHRQFAQSEMLHHGGTYWTVHLFNYHDDKGLHLVPSIIRDRAPSARIAVELEWTRKFRFEAKTHRRNGSYWAHAARNSIQGAMACIADCRNIRLSASQFHSI